MLANSKLIVYTDGGARGNPGPAALGAVVYDERGKLLKKLSHYLGERTNNEAEYEAVIAALKEAARQKAAEVKIYLDSELVAHQLNSIYKVKNQQMQKLIIQVRNLETNFKKVIYRHIPREKNKLADRLVNQAIDKIDASTN